MRVLVADDEKNIREALVKILTMEGWEVRGAENGLSAQRLFQEEAFDGAILDLKMPGLDGLELLKWVKSQGPDVPVLMISAHGEIRDAVQAMKWGATDYLTKPFDPEELVIRLKSAFELRRLSRNVRIFSQTEDLSSGAEKKYLSPSFLKVTKILEKAAPTPTLLLITGESGTGKEVLAKRAHELSPWSEGPFVAVNVGGLPETLLESELFGYEKGAFTGADRRKTGMIETASGGTLFLDEVGEMTMTLQIKLLRVLQERKFQRLGGTIALPVEARIICATNRNLEDEVKAGRFREDLFYRLHVVPLHLPPLRERREDFPLLVMEILHKLQRKLGKKNLTITQEALEMFTAWTFPGNIRELENRLERASIFCEEGKITGEDLDLPLPKRGAPTNTLDSQTLNLFQMEKRLIEAALLKWDGNQTRAAEDLGITRRTLFNKIREYQLTAPSQ